MTKDLVRGDGCRQYLCHLGADDSSITAITSQFDMISSVNDGPDETNLDCQRSHTYDHIRRFTEKSRKGKVDFTSTIKGDVLNKKIDRQ